MCKRLAVSKGLSWKLSVYFLSIKGGNGSLRIEGMRVESWLMFERLFRMFTGVKNNF